MAEPVFPNIPAQGLTPQLGDHHTLAVTNASGNYNFVGDPLQFAACTIFNTGAKDAYVAFGATNSTVATTSGVPVRAGKVICLSLDGNGWIAAICGGSDTTSLDLFQADGRVMN